MSIAPRNSSMRARSAPRETFFSLPPIRPSQLPVSADARMWPRHPYIKPIPLPPRTSNPYPTCYIFFAHAHCTFFFAYIHIQLRFKNKSVFPKPWPARKVVCLFSRISCCGNAVSIFLRLPATVLVSLHLALTSVCKASKFCFFLRRTHSSIR